MASRNDQKNMDMTLEGNLFEWKLSCEDERSLIYNRCKLKQNIGPYKKGSSVGMILINMDKSLIQLFDNIGDTVPVYSARISFIVGEKI